MALQDTSLDEIVDGAHPLIEAPCPAYSHTTVRRAFIVWMYCGQANKFKEVCNYYHRLEAMEDKLPPAQRALSRHHEFTMFLNPPPTSSFLETHFPNLYSTEPVDPYYVSKLESIKNEKFLFKLEGFTDIKQKGVTTAEILQTSQIIRKYCKSKQCTLRKFLEDFREFATRCNLKETVHNIAGYIRRKELESELKYFDQYPPEFSFLNSTIDANENKKNETADFLNDDNNHGPDDLNGNQGLEIEEETKPDETTQLKLILGVPPATSSPKKVKKPKRYKKENINISNIEDGKYHSAHEFFKSFSNSLEQPLLNVKANSHSQLIPKIEDFVKLYDSQNKKKSRSVDALEEARPSLNVMHSLSLSAQEFFDASMANIKELTTLRKI